MLELELQGVQAAPAEADPRHHLALAQELGHKPGGQGHSYRHRLQVTGSAQREVGAGPAWVETKRVQGGTVRPKQLFCAGTVRRLPDPREQATGAGGWHRCAATQPEGLSGFLPAWGGGGAEQGTWGLGFHPASHPVLHSCRQRQSGCRNSTGLSRRPWRRVCEWLPPSSGTGGPSERGGCSQGEEGVTLPGPG